MRLGDTEKFILSALDLGLTLEEIFTWPVITILRMVNAARRRKDRLMRKLFRDKKRAPWPVVDMGRP